MNVLSVALSLLLLVSVQENARAEDDLSDIRKVTIADMESQKGHPDCISDLKEKFIEAAKINCQVGGATKGLCDWSKRNCVAYYNNTCAVQDELHKLATGDAIPAVGGKKKGAQKNAATPDSEDYSKSKCWQYNFAGVVRELDAWMDAEKDVAVNMAGAKVVNDDYLGAACDHLSFADNRIQNNYMSTWFLTVQTETEHGYQTVLRAHKADPKQCEGFDDANSKEGKSFKSIYAARQSATYKMGQAFKKADDCLQEASKDFSPTETADTAEKLGGEAEGEVPGAPTSSAEPNSSGNIQGGPVVH